MAIADKCALLATMRSVLADPIFAGGAPISAAVSLRPRATSTSPPLQLRSHPRSTAARSSVAVACVARGNPSSGRASRRAVAEEGVAEAADPLAGTVILNAEEARRIARIVAMFLVVQKAYYLREKKISDLNRKILMVVLIGISLLVGYMSVKGHEWAGVLVGTCDKGEKLCKIITAVAAVFK